MSETPIADLVTRMLAEGASHDLIVTAIRTIETGGKVSAAAQRMRRFRERRRNVVTLDVTPVRSVTHVTPDFHKSIENNDLGRNGVTHPPDPLIEDYRKEDKQKIVVLNCASRSDQGYVNSDGTVDFTATEIERVGIDFPLLVDPLGQITHLAESKWMDRIVPQNRKRAILAKLRKDNSKLAAKTPARTEDQKRAAVDERDERIRQREDALEVRNRIHAKPRAIGDGT